MSDQSSESVTRVGTESHASQSRLSSKSRTDGRTDGLTKNHSPSDINSRNATPAGGHNESTSSQPVSPDLSASVPQPNPSAALDLDQIEARLASDRLVSPVLDVLVREDVPALVAEVRRLRQQIGLLEAERDPRVVDELRDLWQRALEREGKLASAVADVMWKATQYGTTKDGDTRAYLVPKGCMHRLIGVAQQNGAHVPVSFRVSKEPIEDVDPRIEQLRAERDAARAEAERLRGVIDATARDTKQYVADRLAVSRAEVGRVREALQAARDLHYPRVDGPGSLVSWSYCSCGAMETFTASDGHTSIGAAHYPCATVRALDAALDGEQR